MYFATVSTYPKTNPAGTACQSLCRRGAGPVFGRHRPGGLAIRLALGSAREAGCRSQPPVCCTSFNPGETGTAGFFFIQGRFGPEKIIAISNCGPIQGSCRTGKSPAQAEGSHTSRSLATSNPGQTQSGCFPAQNPSTDSGALVKRNFFGSSLTTISRPSKSSVFAASSAPDAGRSRNKRAYSNTIGPGAPGSSSPGIAPSEAKDQPDGGEAR